MYFATQTVMLPNISILFLWSSHIGSNFCAFYIKMMEGIMWDSKMTHSSFVIDTFWMKLGSDLRPFISSFESTTSLGRQYDSADLPVWTKTPRLCLFYNTCK